MKQKIIDILIKNSNYDQQAKEKALSELFFEDVSDEIMELFNKDKNNES